MPGFHAITLAIVLGLALSPAAANADSPGRITGLGGVFFKSKDPKKLTAWYQDVLGIHIESWGGAMLPYDAPGHPHVLVWSPFPETTHHFAPSTREYMIDFGVDDLDAFIAKLKAKGITILSRDDDPTGKFAWIVDPDGTKIELWQSMAK